jgi:hypothetical protein
MTSKDAASPNQGAPGSEPSDAAVLAMLQRIAARHGPTAASAGSQPAAPDPPAPATAAPASGTSPSESRDPHMRRRRLGEILLDEGLVTREQLEAALRLQAEERPGVPIGQILVSAACKIDVVTATGAALRRAFGRVYGDRPATPPPAAPDDPAMRELREQHTETMRRLTALRAASERVRHDLDAGARLLKGIERPPGEATTPPAAPPAAAPGTARRRAGARPPQP